MANVDFNLKDPRTAALFGLTPEGERTGTEADGLLASGVTTLVMCRESGSLPELLEGLIEQTLAHFGQGLPGSQLLREAGMRAFVQPETLPKEVEWARFRFGGARAILLRHGSVIYLYSMASAAKLNESGRNDFSELFCRILEATRPRDVVVANFSRLVRSLSHSPRLQDVIQRRCSRVRTMQQDIDISSPMGQLLWQVFAMLASSERDAIVQRLFHGRLMMWKRGHWPMGDSRAIPLGYHLVDKVLHVDPDQKELLTGVLEVLADASLTDTDAAHRVREMVAGHSRNKSSEEDLIPDRGEARSPQMLLARLMRWMDFYLTGEYRFPITLPYEGLSEFQGLPVEMESDEHGKARPLIRLPYSVGKPDVEPELIARAREVRTPRKGDSVPPAAPLIARTWTCGDETLAVQSWNKSRYSIVRRSGSPSDGPRTSSSGAYNGRVIATIDEDEIHSSILAAVAEGLESGVLAERLDMPARVASLTGTTRVDRIGARMEVLKEQRVYLEREIAGAIHASTRTVDTANVDALLERATELRQDLARLDESLRHLETQRALPPPPLETFETDGDVILSALSMLRCPDGAVSPEARHALAQVLTDFRLEVRHAEIEWQAFLMLPQDDYEVRLGPFTGTVPRHGRILPEALLNDPTVDVGLGERISGFEARLREQGMPHLAAKCAARAPQGLLPRILLGEEVIWPDCQDDFDHAEFNDYLRECWTDPAWSGRQYVRTHRPRQLLTDIVASAGGRIDLESALKAGEGQGLKYQQVQYIMRGSHEANDVTREWVPPVMREGEWGCTSAMREHFLLSRMCWSCGEPATAVVRVLEVPGDLMCRSCNTAVDLPGRVFPPLYVAMALHST